MRMGGSFAGAGLQRRKLLVAAVAWMAAALLGLPASAAETSALVGTGAPLADGSRVAPMTARYRISLMLDGEEHAFHSAVEWARESRDGASVWRVETRSDAPFGAVVDVVYLKTGDLSPVHRSVTAGEGRISLDFATDAVSGVISEPGAQDRPVAVESEGPVVGDLALWLAGVALAPGFEATIQTLDVEAQRVRSWRVEVAGVESVEVPAGRFGAYRLDIADLDGDGLSGAVWMTREVPRRMVRSELNRPGAGRILAELAPDA